MDVVAAAAAMEATGRPVLHLEVGQPASGAPPEVCEAATAALERERLGYTVAQVRLMRPFYTASGGLSKAKLPKDRQHRRLT
jgi:aspartate/methionine/tyrosine aminotransferase